jgi:predicted RNA polymerase sigma factor
MSKFQDNGNSSTGTVSQLTEYLFRREAGKIISVLTGFLGIERLHLSEEIAHEAFVRA